MFKLNTLASRLVLLQLLVNVFISSQSLTFLPRLFICMQFHQTIVYRSSVCVCSRFCNFQQHEKDITAWRLHHLDSCFAKMYTKYWKHLPPRYFKFAQIKASIAFQLPKYLSSQNMFTNPIFCYTILGPRSQDCMIRQL